MCNYIKKLLHWGAEIVTKSRAHFVLDWKVCVCVFGISKTKQRERETTMGMTNPKFHRMDLHWVNKQFYLLNYLLAKITPHSHNICSFFSRTRQQNNRKHNHIEKVSIFAYIPLFEKKKQQQFQSSDKSNSIPIVFVILTSFRVSVSFSWKFNHILFMCISCNWVID